MLSNLLHNKLVWVPSVFYIPNYYLLSCVYLFLVPLLLHRIFNLLEYKAALFEQCLLIVKRSWPRGQGVRHQFSWSQVRSQYVAKSF